jgi:aminobenzoyl-glutamate transport protein
MRRYRPDMSLGDMIILMFPYSICFLVAWTVLLLTFFLLGVPFGF